MSRLSCFKAYDIRGKFPEEISEDLAYKIGVAYSKLIGPGSVVVGRDVRLEGPALSGALIRGLTDSGTDVINIGICGTEEVYFQTFSREGQGVGGGIMVTASHNPKGYNGLKMVAKGARPMGFDNDLKKIHDFIVSGNADNVSAKSPKGVVRDDSNKSKYIEHLLGYVEVSELEPLKILVNPGNGPAGSIIKLLEKFLPFEFIYINEKPDGNFPNGVPNPMIVENRKATSEAVRKFGADLGVAWDGDFDRCFLFDENGEYIEAYYIIGLLATSLLRKNPGSKIVHDPRLTWNTLDIVRENGGKAIESKSGHSYIKEKMRQENAIYGGEMSAHHYFQGFAYCDSGMLPWLFIAQLLSASKLKTSELVRSRMQKYPCSGEINYKAEDSAAIFSKLERHFSEDNPTIKRFDGLSMEFPNWRFNLRASNTEPLIRLNVEVMGGRESVALRVQELEKVILG